jgi:hypothetical protein
LLISKIALDFPTKKPRAAIVNFNSVSDFIDSIAQTLNLALQYRLRQALPR